MLLYCSRDGSAVTADNNLCSAPVNSWVTAVKANLIHIPDGTQVGIRYQVNLSGTGWLSWAEDGAETGGAEGVMPLESIRMELTGSGAAAYDLYYKVASKRRLGQTGRPMVRPPDRRVQASGWTAYGLPLRLRVQGFLRNRWFPMELTHPGP